MEKTKKGLHLHLTTGIITIALTVVGAILFLMSFTTNYYTFGEMNSTLILGLLIAAVVCTVLSILLTKRFPDRLWPKFLTFGTTALLAAAAILILGDRVEGIGNTIVSDYDSGHGGEEAIYMSLAGAVTMLVAMIYNIIGSFHQESTAPAGKAKTLGLSISAAALGVAAIVATLALVGVDLTSGTKVGPGGLKAGTYTVSFNTNNENLENIGAYQFLCSDLSGMLTYDARFYIDMTLTLDGKGGYTLVSDAYCVENGKRAEIGDDTGLGMILNTTAEGTYVVNDDGTVTTSRADHAVFRMEMDTYSQQMKGAAGMNVNGNDADGTYDSADEPAVLDFVPETAWTLDDAAKAIVSYKDANAGGTYTVSLNVNNGNLDGVADYQFLCSDLSGMLTYDARFYIDLTLELDGNGNYTLVSDAYCVENGKRAEIGDDTGLGMILTTTAEGTYTENADGTITTHKATHAVFQMEMDTYSQQMKGAANMNVNGSDADGTYDSNDEPTVLDFVPETVWTLDNGSKTILSWYDPNAETEDEGGEEENVEVVEVTTVASDDGATAMTFFTDGTYKFAFDAYGIEDLGTYTYENGVLTVTDANGVEITAEGDPLKLHYTYSQSDQLTGDFTIPAESLTVPVEAGEAVAVIPSDDGGTEMTFYDDGTYRFWFEGYSIEDLGTYTYEGGILTLTDVNGLTYTADGDPMQLHYGYSGAPDQLTGDYTIPASALAGGETAEVSGNRTEVAVIPSDDGGTEMTFYTDGTYRFWFESYSIEDLGTYTYENGVLTLTDVNGAQSTADGDPMHLHYAYSMSDQLTGDYTIPAALLGGESGNVTASAGVSEPVTFNSDDEATTMTFNPDGTYVFAFAAYGIEDPGTYTWDGTTLTVTNAAGAEVTATGDPLTFRYVSGVSDQLTGDFTVPVSDLK